MSRNIQGITQTQGKDRRCVVSFVMRAHELTTSALESIFKLIANSFAREAKKNILFASQCLITTRRRPFGRYRYALKRQILNYISLFNCTILFSIEQISIN